MIVEAFGIKDKDVLTAWIEEYEPEKSAVNFLALDHERKMDS